MTAAMPSQASPRLSKWRIESGLCELYASGQQQEWHELIDRPESLVTVRRNTHGSMREGKSQTGVGQGDH